MEVFFSYAHEDEKLQAALIKHLALLPIESWHHRQITAGEEWRSEIDTHLKSAQIILLLISSDFLASEYCRDIELQIALKRHERGEARVIPVILRPVDWHDADFGKLAALPSNGQPITIWKNQDEAFTNVARGLRRVIQELQMPQPVDQSVDQLVVEQNSVARIPQLQKISYFSVRLDKSGEVLERPSGSALIFQEDLGEGIFMRMVQIPAGEYTIGSPATEKERLNQERPQYLLTEPESHRWQWQETSVPQAPWRELMVSAGESPKKNELDQERPQHLLTVPEFYLGQTLVTQSQWRVVMGDNPSCFTGDDKLPVDSVSWLDAMNFCQKLSQKTGRFYQLPSEAQWEYACRANSSTPFSFGETITPSVVNYDGNFPYANAAPGEFRSKTTPVGSFSANLFGLYDMHGNLCEWCLDEWINNYNDVFVDGSARGDINSRSSDRKRLLRGGSWFNVAMCCRSAVRGYYAASYRNFYVGFRVVIAPASTPSSQNLQMGI
jgi:formylglycine-generating enzyme required for sulfatase activity